MKKIAALALTAAVVATSFAAVGCGGATTTKSATTMTSTGTK